MNKTSLLSVETNTSNGAIDLRILDRRPDVLSLFGPLDDAQRKGLAVDAWTVGLRAVMNANRQAEEARLGDIGRALRDDLERESKAFVERQERTLVQVLTRYFDPKDGQIVARLEGFVRDGGELARTMEKYLAPDRGMLAQVLARDVGQNSPIFKLLNPTEADGLVQVLEGRIQEAIEAQQAALVKALDPLAQDGAVARFLKSLQEKLQTSDAGREKQLAAALAALNANDEGSLLSRLMRETQAARQHMIKAMNPELSGSPMAVLKSTLITLLEQHAKAREAAQAAFEAKQLKLLQETNEKVARIDERRRGDARSIRGGFKFQDAVVRFVADAVKGAPVLTELTATTVGSIVGCKIGDLVLELTAESAFPGARVVVEAKQEAGVTVSKGLKELEAARANRGASVGVLVLARSHAQPGFGPLRRHGKDILVIWDESDESADAYLHAALLLALALASRGHRPEDEGNIAALSDIESRIQAELARLETMRELAVKIEKNARELQDEVRKGGNKLDLLLRHAKSTLKALNVELEDVEAAAAIPVALVPGSLDAARAGLLRRPDAGPPVAAE
jgi:hypothetical protein